MKTNLNGLTEDHTSAFVHFPSGATQTWLLVRLPRSALPEGPTPDDVKKSGAAGGPAR